MTTRAPYRRHPTTFKLQVCREIRAGKISRREAQEKYHLSANLIQRWLTAFDQSTMAVAEPTEDGQRVASYEERIAALERKVGQLTMELDRLRLLG